MYALKPFNNMSFLIIDTASDPDFLYIHLAIAYDPEHSTYLNFFYLHFDFKLKKKCTNLILWMCKMTITYILWSHLFSLDTNFRGFHEYHQIMKVGVS